MALVASSSVSSPPDPTATLQAALADFQTALTIEQKQQFNTQVQQFNQQQLDSTSCVIQFVAQIDAVNHGKTRSSVSSRLCTFLDATRQFTNIVDTFVSSSPAIAALVWGGMKTTILIASNAASYFDKVASMIMSIGKICPIYREFSHLYSSSTALQQALCDYYTIVVRLATRVVQVSSRTFAGNIWAAIASPFESEFKPFQDELTEASQLVKEYISLAAKKAAQASTRLVELESKENRLYRKFVGKLASGIRAEHQATQQLRLKESARRTAETRIYIQDQLSTIDPHIPWKHAQKQRLTGTAEWFRQEPQFQAWEADPKTAALWCSGRMGAGKTILTSNIVSHLHLSLPVVGHTISFHFCRPDDPASLLARHILGTLARQILHPYIKGTDEDQLRLLRDKSRHANSDDIVNMVSDHLDKATRYYIIIDGLDECTHDQITELVRSLNKLYKPTNRTFKVIFSGRPELEYQLFQAATPKYRLPLSKASLNHDIERYIDAELDRCLREQKITLVDPETIWKIMDTLSTTHDGLLLFARLFIEELCILGNERAILQALGNPPRKINDLIARRFHRIQDHHLAIGAVKILQYCGCTKRPLTIDELSELLSLTVSQKSLDRASIPPNMDHIITACYGLVYFEEEELTIQYVHNSVKHYLFAKSDIQPEGFIESEIDLHIGSLCLTYLGFNDFKRSLTRTTTLVNTPIAPIDIGIKSLRMRSNIVNEMARKLLQARRSTQHITVAELSRRTEDILGEADSSRLKSEIQSYPYYLLDYVRTHWIWHMIRFDEKSQDWHRFIACVSGENDLARRPWTQVSDPQQVSDATSQRTSWALAQNHRALLLYDVVQNHYALAYAKQADDLEQDTMVKGRQEEIMRHAVEVRDSYLARAVMSYSQHNRKVYILGLRYAVSLGDADFVEFCIKAGADVNAMPDDDENRTALQAAAEQGHLAIVERLLQARANVNAEPARWQGLTALQAAAGGGRLEVVERLLQANADVNAKPAEWDGRTALQAAAEGGHLEVVERLLQANADVNTEPAFVKGKTALQAAAERGHLEVVERLLQAKADVNAEPAMYDGMTALQAALGGRHLAVVERLKLAGATE